MSEREVPANQPMNLRQLVSILNAVEWEMEHLKLEIRRDVRRELHRHELQYHTTRVVPHHLSDEDVAWREDEGLN